jgi:hypothetical protein
MNAHDRLQVVLDRERLSAAELRLQPEFFQATTLLDQSAGDLSDLLQEFAQAPSMEKNLDIGACWSFPIANCLNDFSRKV